MKGKFDIQEDISRNCDIGWPSESCDRTPLDYSLGLCGKSGL